MNLSVESTRSAEAFRPIILDAIESKSLAELGDHGQEERKFRILLNTRIFPAFEGFLPRVKFTKKQARAQNYWR